MGVLALGIGFGTPLAIAGVVVHVAGHGLAKALGFYAAIPLLRQDPSAARARPARRRPARAAPTATAMSVSLVSLAGLPPSPLFVSEVMILLGGMDAGLIGGLLDRRRAARARLPRARPRAARGAARGRAGGRTAALPLGAGRSRCSPARRRLALLALTVAAYALPGSDIVDGADEERRMSPGAAAATRASNGCDVAAADWRDACRGRARRRRALLRGLRRTARARGGAGMRSSPAARARAILTSRPRRGRAALDRRPRARGGLGRARGPRSLRPALRRPRAAAPARRPPQPTRRAGRSRSRATASTRSPSGRSTPA